MHIYNYDGRIQKNSMLMWKGVGVTKVYQTGWYSDKGKRTLLKVSRDGMSCEITKLMQIPMNTLCYLIKLVSLFPSYVIYSPNVALSIFVTSSNFCRIIKLMPSWGFGLFSSGFTLVWWFHRTSLCAKLSAGKGVRTQRDVGEGDMARSDVNDGWRIEKLWGGRLDYSRCLYRQFRVDGM